ncbi:MAG: 4Fe-4S dicluster domain-containing protein [Anaerolineales bacterium]|jgi:Fe-S-cluster-containing dehydrogenase component|nr:4Fe-4S dicluster domain-containing protein [Anaerolineales bacterium]
MSKKKTKVTVEITRRDVLTLAGVAAGSAAAAVLLTSGPLSPFSALKQEQLDVEQENGGHGATGDHHWGMVISLDQCIGCEYCLRACSAVNDVKTDKPWNIVVEEKNSAGHPFYFSRPCLHCQNAPCVEVCPVKATYHREDGLVVMDYDRCIGCRYCEVACPYDARKFNWETRDDVNPYIPTWGIAEVERRPRGVVEKCTFCIHRIDAGLKQGLTPGVHPEATPACVNICPVGARVFGDLKDPNSQVSILVKNNPTVVLREELGTRPSVLYLPPKEGL